MIYDLKVYWPLTKTIVTVMHDLENGIKERETVNSRINELISRPLASITEREVSKALLECQYADKIIEIMNRFIDENPYTTVDECQSDVVSLHRIALECLSRIALKARWYVVVIY